MTQRNPSKRKPVKPLGYVIMNNEYNEPYVETIFVLKKEAINHFPKFGEYSWKVYRKTNNLRIAKVVEAPHGRK